MDNWHSGGEGQHEGQRKGAPPQVKALLVGKLQQRAQLLCCSRKAKVEQKRSQHAEHNWAQNAKPQRRTL